MNTGQASCQPCMGSDHLVQTMDSLTQTYEGTDEKANGFYLRIKLQPQTCPWQLASPQPETSSGSHIILPSQDAFVLPLGAFHPLMQVAWPNPMGFFLTGFTPSLGTKRSCA